MDRRKIRERILADRKQMLASELERLGALIADNLLQDGCYQRARCIHCFVGVTTKGEIPTDRIRNDIISSGKTLVLPKVTEVDGKMIHVKVADPKTLQPGIFGIPEPAGSEEVALWDLDLIIVPGLAVDMSGNRIGYGKGYYDRFLSRTERAVTVMLVPERYVLARIPAEEHDVPVHFIATEKAIHACRR